MTQSPDFPLQGLIVQSGALLELKRLITQQEFPEIQCHAAGTLRNLAAENQFQVSLRGGRGGAHNSSLEGATESKFAPFCSS